MIEKEPVRSREIARGGSAGFADGKRKDRARGGDRQRRGGVKVSEVVARWLEVAGRMTLKIVGIEVWDFFVREDD